MSGSRIPRSYLEQHNKRVAEELYKADMQRWISRELGEKEKENG